MQSVTNNLPLMQQLRADLHWLINSPMLIVDHADFIDDDFWQSQAVNIDKALENTTLVNSIFADLRPMVGLYFERLVLFWLKSNPDYANIQQHIRLTENKKTIGEMDFLFRDRVQQKSYHWEVAVKYFLLHDPHNHPQLIGPNPADTYEKKYLKMLQHQLPLSSSPLAKSKLLELGYDYPPQARGLVKGCLFYPSDCDRDKLLAATTMDASFPQRRESCNIKQIIDSRLRGNDKHAYNQPFLSISAHHNRGWWTSVNDLHIPAKSAESRWLVLSKPFWFALADIENRKKFELTELKHHLRTHFNNTNHGVFLAELVQNNNQWSEVSRGFVVNATWPQT